MGKNIWSELKPAAIRWLPAVAQATGLVLILLVLGIWLRTWLVPAAMIGVLLLIWGTLMTGTDR